jgi:hypothetical protein
MVEAKPFSISKHLVAKAYRLVKANRGAAGVDGESLRAFDKDLKDNLYKVWNRMSSGSYFPPPVRLVEIPKGEGGMRPLGIPTVADRIAQTVAKVSPRLVRLSAWQVGTGRGGGGAEALLSHGLGHRSGYPRLFRELGS